MRHDSGPDKKKTGFFYLFFNSLQDWAHLRSACVVGTLGTLGKGWRTDVYLQEMLLTAIGGDFNDFVVDLNQVLERLTQVSQREHAATPFPGSWISE